MKEKNPAAVALGKLGGSKKSDRKTLAARENAKKPRKKALEQAVDSINHRHALLEKRREENYDVE